MLAYEVSGDDFVNETEENKKDDHGFEDDKLGEETMDSKKARESVEAKKPELEVMEEEIIPEDNDEGSEKEKSQEEGEDDKSNEDVKVEEGLEKCRKGKVEGQKVKKENKGTKRDRGYP